MSTSQLDIIKRDSIFRGVAKIALCSRFLACSCAEKHNLCVCVMGHRPVQPTNSMHAHVHSVVARVHMHRSLPPSSMEFGKLRNLKSVLVWVLTN